MTRLEALKELAQKVEAGVYDVRAIRAVWPFREGYDDPGSDACYVMKDGSLDAALALHDAVLPFGYDSFDTFSLSGEVVLKRTKPVDRFYAFADCDPARAWLLAVLRALIAQEDTQ